MKIPGGMIAHYFGVLLSKIEDYDESVYYVAPSGELLLKLSELDKDIEWIRKEAEHYNEMSLLRLAIEHLLLHSELKIMKYTHGHYLHSEEALRQALAYLHEKLWPKTPLPKESLITEKELRELEDWWLARNKLREEEEAKKQKPEKA